ncbi:MAG: PilZ domain-containing protein [Planctomycetota bacterium]
MTHDNERRRAPRVRVAAVAALETKGSLSPNNQGLGVVKNVSRTGIGLETGQPPIPGQTVILRLALDDQTHELRTRATRVDRRGTGHFFDVGLDWGNCTTEQLAFLDAVLAVVEKQPLA